jgi:hypothetical protein
MAAAPAVVRAKRDGRSAGRGFLSGQQGSCIDCVQVVIALVVIPENYPLAYEVMPGAISSELKTPESPRSHSPPARPELHSTVTD